MIRMNWGNTWWQNKDVKAEIAGKKAFKEQCKNRPEKLRLDTGR